MGLTEGNGESTYLKLAMGLAAASMAVGCASAKNSSEKNADLRKPASTDNQQEADPYIWLEDSKDPAVTAWAATRSAKASAALEGDKRFKGVADQIRKITEATDRIPVIKLEGGKVRNLWSDADHIRGLWRQTTPASFSTKNPQWETLIDVDQLNKQENKSWVFEGANCLAPDANLCLISLSDGGRDEVEVREFNVSQKSFITNGFMIPSAKTDLNWIDADTVLIATNLAPSATTTSGYARQVKRWKRGQPLAQAELLFEGKADDLAAGATVTARPESSNIYLSEGLSFFTSKNFLFNKDGKLQALPFPDDAIFQGEFKGRLIASLRTDLKAGAKTFAAGSLIALPVDKAFLPNALSFVEVIFAPTSQAIFEGLSTTRDHLLLSVLNNVKGELWSYTPQTSKTGATVWAKAKLKIPEGGTIDIRPADAFDKSNRYYIGFESFLVPSSLYAGEVGGAEPQIVKQLGAKFDAHDMVAEQFFSTSQDGTKIPYYVIRKKGLKLNGQNPTLLYAYGGFEDSQTPFYMRSTGKVWLERGGVFVLANIRGGGEFGPSWHSSVLKYNRQLVYQDFASVAQDLIKRKLTSPRRLGIKGGSNGGLLMGVAETQHPDYYHAVICESALLDMIRYTKLPPGASWIGEYGDPDDPKMAEYILTYSPYQNLKEGVKYPKTFFHISTADDRVQPGHTRKMAARMEQYGNDLLFFENTEGGHGGAADLEQTVRKAAMENIFLYQQLMD